MTAQLDLIKSSVEWLIQNVAKKIKPSSEKKCEVEQNVEGERQREDKAGGGKDKEWENKFGLVRKKE